MSEKKEIEAKSGSDHESGLKRTLGLFDTSMIFIGIVLGSGIFLTSGIMAESLPSVPLLICVWLAGGLITLLGSFIFSELGASMPEAGGQYVYLRKAYGPLMAFLYGWITLLVYMGGAIAGLGIAFSEYFGKLFPFFDSDSALLSLGCLSISRGQFIAVFIILLLSAVNYLGGMLGKTLQNVVTVVKIVVVLTFIILGLSVASENVIDYSFNPLNLSTGNLISGFALAMVAVFWTYDGWNNVNFVAGEIKNPGKNLTRGLISGTLVITILYLFVNIVYFKALPVDKMAGVVTIAESASEVLFGRTATIFLTCAILVSVFGALNGTIFVGARVYYAMARDKLFFSKASHVHPKFKTPAFAIVIQAICASILALSGSFEQILTYVIFGSVIFWIAAAASVYTLRNRYPEMKRPYLTWGYPFTPAIFILVSIGILVNTLIESPMESLAGLGFIIIGIPVYYFWRKK